MRTIQALFTVAALSLAVSGGARPADACVILGGGNTKVAGEEVLIVYDSIQHVEHFVRHMTFSDASHEFGFLVPTPAQPTLADADDAVFSRLFAIYQRPQPRAVHSNAHGPDGLVAASAVAPPVQVLEHRTVAGLDATVLSASSAAALNTWLGAHHYPSSPSLQRYLQPYVRNHFFITAFRYVPGQGQTRFGTKAVRMTFPIDRPYFPYAEPDDAPHVPGRIFRLSLITNERMSGVVGGHPWGARTVYAAQSTALRHALGGAVSPMALLANSWITVFQEDESVRGHDDLYFVSAHTQSPVASTVDRPVD